VFTTLQITSLALTWDKKVRSPSESWCIGKICFLFIAALSTISSLVSTTVIAHELPKHLSEVYGANAKAVEAKIAKLRFDWKTFSPEKCTVVYSSGNDAASQDKK
jgi:hypothetical protein